MHRPPRVIVGSTPDVVIAADWSSNSRKRRAAWARWSNGVYIVEAPTAVGDDKSLIQQATSAAGRSGSALIGFDFPIGLPSCYASVNGISSLRAALPEF